MMNPAMVEVDEWNETSDRFLTIEMNSNGLLPEKE
jgi:hypothetical protein